MGFGVLRNMVEHSECSTMLREHERSIRKGHSDAISIQVNLRKASAAADRYAAAFGKLIPMGAPCAGAFRMSACDVGSASARGERGFARVSDDGHRVVRSPQSLGISGGGERG